MTTPPDILITAEGLEEVKRELAELTGERRPDIVSKIKAARELGDLKENAEYHAARNEQSFIEGRIKELEGIVRNAKLIEPPSRGGEVGLLNRVTVLASYPTDDGTEDTEETYQLVGPAEADPMSGRISNESAIGKALMGRRAGEVVPVVTEANLAFRVKILRVD